MAGVIEIYGCPGDADPTPGSLSTGWGGGANSSAVGGGTSDPNLVCPFCTTFPRERIGAWMEDMSDSMDQGLDTVYIS